MAGSGLPNAGQSNLISDIVCGDGTQQKSTRALYFKGLRWFWAQLSGPKWPQNRRFRGYIPEFLRARVEHPSGRASMSTIQDRLDHSGAEGSRIQRRVIDGCSHVGRQTNHPSTDRVLRNHRHRHDLDRREPRQASCPTEESVGGVHGCPARTSEPEIMPCLPRPEGCGL